MNIKQLRKFTHFLLLTLLVTSFLAVFTPTYASAAQVDSDAKSFCDGKNYQNSGNDKTNLGKSCQKGYIAGFKGSSGGDCFSWAKKNSPSSFKEDQIKNTDLYKACAVGKVQGKADKKGTATGSAAAKQEFKGSDCGSVKTFFDFSCGSGTSNKSGGSDNPIFRILLTVIAWLTAGVMVAVIGGIIYGGFLYMTAQANASQTQKGIQIIVDAVIGLIAFGLMWTLLNFIIPGGIYAG